MQAALTDSPAAVYPALRPHMTEMILYNAAKEYVYAHGGSMLVSDGITIEDAGGDAYRVVVHCLGRRPAV